MDTNHSHTLPDLNQALRVTEQYEEYKYLRVWGLVILIDAIGILLFHLFNLIYTGFYKIGLLSLLKTGLTGAQFFVLLILVIKIGKTTKRTRLKLGKIDVSQHRAFFWGFIGIKGFSTIFELVEMALPFSSYSPYVQNYFLISFALNITISLMLYYVLMRKLALKHDFKEIKYAIFFYLGWLGFIIISVIILHVEEYFGWNPIFVRNVNYLLTLIFFSWEVSFGAIAFKKAKNMIGEETNEAP